MSYFAILGKHPKLSLAELSILKPENINIINNNIVIFNIAKESDYMTNILNNLAGITKWWKIVNLEDMSLSGKTIGTNDDDFGMELKKKYGAKRYKFVEMQKSDLEIKKEWIEIIKIKENIYGQVLWYQDIGFFEVVDFGKPSHGMQIGMMPTKLAMTMINLWLRDFIPPTPLIKGEAEGRGITIYDPFCGFGTTGFVANHMWYNFVWSDINISMIKPNKKRWLEDAKTINYRKDKYFSVFVQDATKPIDNPTVKKVDLIVTEWRLWPITWTQTHINEVQRNAKIVWEVYQNFLQNCDKIYDNIVLVITYPVYRRSDYEDIIWPKLTNWMRSNWRKSEMVDLYARADHVVARQILICKK